MVALSNLALQVVSDRTCFVPAGTGFKDAQVIVLGHIIAPEVGLPPGPDSHSSEGVMNLPSGKKIVQHMERG